ncbi:MAG: transglutaminase-like domain-containing protein [Longimicrobiales bacterium]
MARRRALGLAVIALWLSVLGWHVRREYFKTEELVLAAGSRMLAPGSYFYVIRMNGAAIGLATSRLDTVPDGFLAEDFLSLDVPALDTVHRALVQTRVELSRALRLQRFDFELESAIGRFTVAGVAEGDTALALTIGSGGEVQRTRLQLGRDVVLPTALPLRLAAAGRLEVGQEFSIDLFDPSVMAPRPTRLRVTARDTLIVPDSAALDAAGRWFAAGYDTVPVWRVEEEFSGVRAESWVDANGRVIRAATPLGFALERTEYELAQAEWTASRSDPALARGYGQVIESTAIASNVDLGDTGGRDRLRIRLLDVDLEGFDLAGGRQRLHGDTLAIERESAALHAGYRLPYRGSGEAARELAATPLIQADDPRIRSLAAGIAHGSDDPAVVAQRLNQWVYRTLRKDITLSIPSALQVLEQRQGDCNEHTVLYVALARALGLPARTAVGLVYVDGRFYYHAWPEVWLEDWVAVDPTLGQVPADAAHLRLLVGGLARQIELIRVIGRLRLEVIA